MLEQNRRVHVMHADPAMNVGLYTILSAQSILAVTHGAPDAAPPPDAAIVVTDYTHGIECARRAAGLPQVMVVTERDREWDVRSALEAGVRGYILQSSSSEEIQRAVEDIADGHRHVSGVVERRIVESAGLTALTDRELEVLALLSEGCSNKQIARRLDIGLQTVKSHVRKTLAKLGANARTQAVMIAVKRGLVVAGAHAVAETVED